MTERAAEADALRRLSVVRVAKDLFLTDWYLKACESLLFDAEACGVLADVARETRGERSDLVAVMERWAETSGEARGARDVAHYSRVEFLQMVMQAKVASGEMLEKAAHLAPHPLRDDLLRLAAVDFRHATRVRALLEREAERLERVVEGDAGGDAGPEAGREAGGDGRAGGA